MKSFFFWNRGSALDKVWSWIIFLMFTVVLGWSIWGMYQGTDAVLSWMIEPNTEIETVLTDTFQKYFFEFNITSDAYLLAEKYVPADMTVEISAYHIYFGLVVIGWLVFLTGISDLHMYPYLGGVSLFVLFWVWAHLEGLQVASGLGLGIDYDQYFFLAILLTFLPLTYLYHRVSVHYLLRFLSYLILAIGFSWVVYEYSLVEMPVVHIFTYNMYAPVIVVLLFCMLVGQENIRAILYAITEHTAVGTTGSARHFMILSGIYMANLVYTFLYFSKMVDLGELFVHPFYVFVGSAVVGIWGDKSREDLLGEFINTDQAGFTTYIGMAIIALSSIAFSLYGGNTALQEVYEDTILYTHIAVGLSFFIYIFGNYGDPLIENQKVHRLLYKHERVPYVFIQGVAILIIFIFLFRADFFPLRQIRSAMFNAMGEMEELRGDDYAAKQYYAMGLNYDPKNFHSNYALGEMALEAKDYVAAKIFFEDAVYRKGNPYAYAQLVDLELKDKKFFQALFRMEEGLVRNMNAGELYNNMALMVNKVRSTDTTLYYVEKALAFAKNKTIPEANSYHLWIQGDIYTELSQLDKILPNRPYISTKANRMAFAAKFGDEVSPVPLTLRADSLVGTPEMLYWYNYSLTQTDKPTDELLAHFEALSRPYGNISFDLYLNLSKAHLYFSKGDYLKAFQHYKYLYEHGGATNYYYARTFGMRLLQIGRYEEAAYYFNKAFYRGDEQSWLFKAIALSERKDKTEAIEAWSDLFKNGKPEYQDISKEMLSLLKDTNLEGLDSIGDVQKYRLLHYQMGNISDAQFDKGVALIKKDLTRALAIYDRLKFYIDQKNEASANLYIKKLSGFKKEGTLLDVFAQGYLAYHHFMGEYSDDFVEKVKTATYPRGEQGLKDYYLASYYDEKGDSTLAHKHYQQAIIMLPYKEDVYLGYASFLTKTGQAELAYETVLQGHLVNEQSVILLKTYILSALSNGYDRYAKDGLEGLSSILKEEEYQDFLQIYHQKEQEVAASIEGLWGE